MFIKQSAMWCLAIAIGVCSAQLTAQDAENPADETSKMRQEQRVFTVEHASIESVANQLKDLFESDDNKWMIQVTDKRIRVSGSQEQLRAAEEMISSLERDAASKVTASNIQNSEHIFQAFALGDTTADLVAQTLEQIYLDDKSLRVEADIERNRLLVYGTQERMDEIRQIIAQLEGPANPERKERAFRLNHPVDSRDVVRRLEELFGDERKWSANVTHDRIQFVGSEEQIDAAAKLVAELNAASSAPANGANASDTQKSLRVFRSDAVDADLARRVLSTLMEGSKGFRIETDPANNQLIVAGTADDMKQVDSILKTLSEQAPLGVEEEVRAFDLMGIDPITAVQLLEKLLEGEGDVRIDATSNQLLFRGTRQQTSLVEKVLEQLDQKSRQVKVFSLENSDATELVVMLKELLGSKDLSFSVDPRTNAIVATGSEKALEVVNALLLTLDVQDTAASQSRRGASTLVTEARGRGAREDSDSVELNDAYASSERDAASRAAICRWAEASGGSSDEELRTMKADLQAAVERAFAARQEAQSAEVDQLRRQLTAIETRVRQREAIKDQIIERRVEDLLANVDTSWWPQAPAASPAGTVTQVGHLPENVDPSELTNPLVGNVQVEYVEGLDIVVLRGKESDVKSVQDIIKRIERNADQETRESAADEPAARP